MAHKKNNIKRIKTINTKKAKNIENNISKQSNQSILISLFDKISKYQIVFSILFAAIPFLLSLINSFYNFNYQKTCSKFYHIPEKYFSDNINNYLVYFMCFAFFFIAVFLLLWVKRQQKHNTKSQIFYTIYINLFTIIIGFILGIVSIYSFIETVKYISKRTDLFNLLFEICNQFSYITIVLLICFAIFSIWCILNADKIRLFKFKKICVSIWCFCTFITYSFIISGTLAMFSSNISEKCNYEFISIENENYAVLSEYGNDYLIINATNDEAGKFIFYVDEYQFVDKTSGKIKYINTETPPKIEPTKPSTYNKK